MRTLLLSAVAVMGLSLMPADAQQPAMTAVATVSQLHDAIISPASDAIFRVGSQAPTTDQEWQALRNSAVMLAEAGNLLMIGRRARDQRAWVKLSRGLTDAGAAALKAAMSKDLEAVNRASDQLIDVCESCHTPYRDGGRTMPKQ